MPRGSYDYSSIQVTGMPAGAATPTKLPLSPPRLPKRSPSYFQMELVDHDEARQISRLYRVLLKMAFWKKRRSSLLTTVSSSTKRISVVPPHSPFYRHKKSGGFPLNKTITTETSSTRSMSLPPDSPTQTIGSSWSSSDSPLPISTTTITTTTTLEPIVSASSDWWSGDSDDKVLLLATRASSDEIIFDDGSGGGGENEDEAWEAIWNPRFDSLEPEDNSEEEEKQLFANVYNNKALMQELEEFSEAMSMGEETNESQLDGEDITLVTLKEDLSVWFRVRSRLNRLLFGKKSSSISTIASKEVIENMQEQEEEDDEKACKTLQDNLQGDQGGTSEQKDEPENLVDNDATPKRKSTSKVAPPSPASHGGSSNGASRTSVRSTLRKLNCSHNQSHDNMDAFELEWPLFAETSEQEEPSREPEPCTHILNQSFGDLSAFCVPSAPIVAAMDPKDHCAQLVLLENDKAENCQEDAPVESSLCMSNLMFHSASLGAAFPFSTKVDVSTPPQRRAKHCGGMNKEPIRHYKFFGNETPVARVRRQQAVEYRDVEEETGSTTTITTRDSMFPPSSSSSSHVRQVSAGSLWDELENSARAPFDEPCHEEALPDTPQRYKTLQKEVDSQKKRGFLGSVQDRYFQPILKDFSLDHLCSHPTAVATTPTRGSPTNLTTVYPVQYNTTCLTPRHRAEVAQLPLNLSPYSDFDYAAAAAESATYDSWK